jgi:xanthine dehydrogenase molybdopterin-binding subunit B
VVFCGFRVLNLLTRPKVHDECYCFADAGVVGYFGADDVPGDNMIGPIMHDEEVFATKEVTCVGQVRACVRDGVVRATRYDFLHSRDRLALQS